MAKDLHDFNFNWEFSKGRHEDSLGGGSSAEFKTVHLPHDWAIEGPFGERSASGGSGKLPWQGQGTYRKSFELSEEDEGQRLQLVFDGVMSSPEVFLNGQKIGEWIYGYNSFVVDGTDAANFGGENTLVVFCDTTDHGSRWYPGAGIYRKVRAELIPQLHLEEWGTFVHTPSVTTDAATVQIEIELNNTHASKQSYHLQMGVVDPSGNTVWEDHLDGTILSGIHSIEANSFEILTPSIWDVEHPNLYTLNISLVDEGAKTHSKSINFGVRTYEWTNDDGFHLNGRRLQIKGVNLHHDHGPLGAAFYPRAMERQLEIMRDMGVNSIRTSHNPAAPELLALCDRMGFVVYNELFDKYGPTAGVNCEHAEYVETYAEREVRNFVKRDRNHASVCIWSIGNEINEILNNVDGLSSQHVEKMVQYFHKYDDTRPTSMGCHITAAANKDWHIFDSLDTAGWNYGEKYIEFRNNYPDTPVIYTESASAFATVGAYKNSLPITKTDWGRDGEINAHVLTSATWSDIPEVEFDRMERHDYVAGEYVWTGFDYLGEPTPYGTDELAEDGSQARSSYFGIVDLCGLPKDSFYSYRSHWNTEEDTLHVAPHWNWKEGENVPVFVYTNGDEAELFVNGKSHGKQYKKENEKSVDASLTLWKTASASSEEVIQDKLGNVQEENYAIKSIDCNPATCWRALNRDSQYLEIDLGDSLSFKTMYINWEKSADHYNFKILISNDHESWTEVPFTQTHSETSSYIELDTKGQYVRIAIELAYQDLDYKACIYGLDIYHEAGAAGNAKSENPYFGVLDKYRIRFLEVPFESGELKVVSYKDGIALGEYVVRTAGEPSDLGLSVDRSSISADGMDLAYVDISLVDADRNLCPWSKDMLSFSCTGAASLIAVGNGDQMGHDCFVADKHPLFYGKALAVLRSTPGETGEAILEVKCGNISNTCKIQIK
ncbi:MAG: DUF4982 domain-containing protein [Lentisphaeria bacterium]|nr:DUF4982 domain-containing protein [Lentisphaeria bacterium]